MNRLLRAIYLFMFCLMSFENSLSEIKDYDLDIKANIKTGEKSGISIGIDQSLAEMEFKSIKIEELRTGEILTKETQKIKILNTSHEKGYFPPNTILEFSFKGDLQKRGYLMPEGQNINSPNKSQIPNNLVAKIKGVNTLNNKPGEIKVSYLNSNSLQSERKKVKTRRESLVELEISSSLSGDILKKEQSKGNLVYTNTSTLQVSLRVD